VYRYTWNSDCEWHAEAFILIYLLLFIIIFYLYYFIINFSPYLFFIFSERIFLDRHTSILPLVYLYLSFIMAFTVAFSLAYILSAFYPQT